MMLGFGPRIARRRRALGVALVIAVTAACSSPETGHRFEIVEDSGIPVAVNSAVPRFEGEIFTYEKVLEIRADPADRETLLYEPRTFTIGDDGLFYVADTGNHRVAVFDADGNLVRTIGREGDGPGEFRDPYLVDLQDGMLTVAATRTSRFRADGTFIDVISAPRPPVQRTREGLLVTFDYPQGPRDDRYYYLGIAAEVLSESRERLAIIESEQVRFARMGEGRTRHEIHYAPWPGGSYDPAADQILITVGDEPVVSWFDLAGRLARQVRIELPPRTLTAEDRARVEDHYDRLIQTAHDAGGDGLAERLTEQKAALEFADPKAHWRSATLEPSGWLWLREPAPDIGSYVRGSPQITQRQSFLIISPEGEFLGRTQWPPEARYFGTRLLRGHLLTMIPDPDTGETIPTAYAIRPAVPGFDYP